MSEDIQWNSRYWNEIKCICFSNDLTVKHSNFIENTPIAFEIQVEMFRNKMRRFSTNWHFPIFPVKNISTIFHIFSFALMAKVLWPHTKPIFVLFDKRFTKEVVIIRSACKPRGSLDLLNVLHIHVGAGNRTNSA